MSAALAIVLIAIIVVAMKVELVRVAPDWAERLDAELDGIPPPHVNCRCVLPAQAALLRGGFLDGQEAQCHGQARIEIVTPHLDRAPDWNRTSVPQFSRKSHIYWRADVAGCTPTELLGQPVYYHESMVKEGTCLDD